MNIIKFRLRRAMRWLHLWLGLSGGLLICLLAVTGGIVSVRPQLAALLSPASPTPEGCRISYDWNLAEQQVRDFSHAEINRIYAPDGTDPRYHFRMMTDTPAIYQHVIYDVCAAKVLGTVNYQWMDWIVDLHHNLLYGRTGRTAGGFIGLGLLVSSLGGFLLWLLSGASVRRVFRLPVGQPAAIMNLDLHRTLGLTAGLLLFAGSFTGLWLCFPQTMRGLLSYAMPVPAEARPPRRAPADTSVPAAGLSELIAAAQRAIPDGSIREIRLPEGYGNAQIRMWRPGDFRSLGNNVVSVDARTAQVVLVDLYSAKPASGRLIQAMAGLHYGEWGGLTFRSLYAAAGFLSAALFLTGIAIWWYTRRRAVSRTVRHDAEPVSEQVTAA